MTGAPSTAPARTATYRHRLETPRRARATAVLAMLGGVAWVAAAVTHATQPAGCVGDGCLTSSMRESTTATTALIVLAALLMLASGVGLLGEVRSTGPLGRVGTIGAALCGLGTLSLATGVALQQLAADGDFDRMPWFVGPGVALIALGAGLVGWTVLRSSVVPRWAGAALIVGAALLILANEQTAAVLLAVPFGLAWSTTGAALLLRPTRVAGSRATTTDNHVSGVGGGL